MSNKRLLGLVLNKGGETSHTAILARTLGIPAILDTGNATELIASGDTVAVDSVGGEVIVQPTRGRRPGDRPQDRAVRPVQGAAEGAQPAAGADPRPAPVPPLRQHRAALRERGRAVLRRQGHRPLPHRVPLPRLQDEHLRGRAVPHLQEDRPEHLPAPAGHPHLRPGPRQVRSRPGRGARTTPRWE